MWTKPYLHFLPSSPSSFSLCLPACLSVFLSLPVCLSLCFSVSRCLSVFVSISASLSLSLSLCLSLCVCLFPYLSVTVPVSHYLCLIVSVSHHLCLSPSLSLMLSVCLPLSLSPISFLSLLSLSGPYVICSPYILQGSLTPPAPCSTCTRRPPSLLLLGVPTCRVPGGALVGKAWPSTCQGHPLTDTETCREPAPEGGAFANHLDPHPRGTAL